MRIPAPRPLPPSLLDPVGVWKHVALSRARSRARVLSAAVPCIHVRVTLGFIALAMLVPLSMVRIGNGDALDGLWILPSIVLVQELQRALVARALASGRGGN
jgi:hypothetical protein